jgi:hypothetical protein
MEKKEVQGRILKDGKKVALSKFHWDKTMRVFTTTLCGLMLDLGTEDNNTIKAEDNNTIKANYNNTIQANYNNTIKAEDNNTIQANYNNTIQANYNNTIQAEDNINILTTSNNNTLVLSKNNTIHIINLNEYPQDKLIRFEIGKEPIIRDTKEVRIVDGKQMVLISTKNLAEGIISHKTQYILDYFNDSSKTQFVVEKDDVYAHGETLKKAIKDLEFKVLQSKDVQEHVKRIKESKVISPYDYRLLTGSCEYGVNEFLIKNNLTWESELTLEEALDITKGEYQHEKFKELLSN